MMALRVWAIQEITGARFWAQGDPVGRVTRGAIKSINRARAGYFLVAQGIKPKNKGENRDLP